MQCTEHNSTEQKNLKVEQSPCTNVEPSLFGYLLTLVKHKKLIFGTTFVVTLITAILSLFMANIYTAKTMILPGDDDKGIMGAMMAQMGGLASIAGDALGGKTKADLYVTLLKSETIKDAIIDRFKLMEAYDAKYRVSVYRELDTNTKITAGKKDGVITIAVDNKDPKLAANIANEYVAELKRFTVNLSMTSAKGNSVFLEKRIAETRADLVKAEEALKTFQSKNKAISVTDQAKATIEGVAQLRAQLAVQEVQLSTLQRQFTDNSQEVKTAKTSIANLKSQIVGLEGRGGDSSSLPNVGSVPELAQQYVRLMREFKIQEAVLEMLVKQYELASLTESKDVSPIQVIQVAKIPERKSKPKRSQIVLLTAFAVGFFMVLVAFMLEFRDRMLPEDRERLDQLSSLIPGLHRLRGLIPRGKN